MKISTQEVHGCQHYDTTGAISQPIYLSATYRHPGYQQSTGYGTSIRWLDGTDPSSARYAVGAGPQTVDGQTVIWMTWAE